jgi:hypothetical protein
MGGLNKISVLDLAAFKENQTVLDTKLSGKTLIAIDQSKDSIFPRMTGLVKTPNVAVVVLTEGDSANSMQVLRSLMTEATSLNMKVNNETLQVISTAPLLTEGLAQKTSFVSSNLRNLENALKVAEVMKLSDDSLLAKIGKEVSKETFLSKSENDVLLTKALGLRVLEDAMQINTAYEAADKARERRELKKRQIRDESLLVAKISDRLEKTSGNEKLAFAMASVPVGSSIEELIEGSKVLERKIGKYTKKAVGEFEKPAKKTLKAFGLVDQVQSVKDSFYAGF